MESIADDSDWDFKRMPNIRTFQENENHTTENRKEIYRERKISKKIAASTTLKHSNTRWSLQQQAGFDTIYSICIWSLWSHSVSCHCFLFFFSFSVAEFVFTEPNEQQSVVIAVICVFFSLFDLL